jgi:hypothetical protein
MRLDEVATAASSALEELLNLDGNTVVSASFDESDRGGFQSNGLLTESSNRVLFSLAGHNEKVAVTPMTIPVQVDRGDESYSFADQAYLSVGWHSQKSPLCWALIGAVALGIARRLTSEIEDNAGFFTNVNIQGPDEFSRSLRLLLDGQLTERNVGEYDHSRLQMALAGRIYNREREWRVRVLPEQRFRVAPGRYRVPDICIVSRDQEAEPDPDEPKDQE